LAILTAFLPGVLMMLAVTGASLHILGPELWALIASKPVLWALFMLGCGFVSC